MHAYLENWLINLMKQEDLDFKCFVNVVPQWKLQPSKIEIKLKIQRPIKKIYLFWIPD